jgi:hypothetical protein
MQDFALQCTAPQCKESEMSAPKTEMQRNKRAAAAKWGILSAETTRELESLTKNHGLCVERGELQLVGGRWYITHAGLMTLAQKNGCLGMETEPVTSFCDPIARRWIFRATVLKAPNSTRFVGFGDADPSNVSSIVAGSEMRIAETRAVNRAVRKAYGIGLCSVDELTSASAATGFAATAKGSSPQSEQRIRADSQVSLRDRLSALIRRHDLDPELVKRYAASFCGTETLRNAGRDMVETFITLLASQAESDREALLCKLNGFGCPSEVKS